MIEITQQWSLLERALREIASRVWWIWNQFDGNQALKHWVKRLINVGVIAVPEKRTNLVLQKFVSHLERGIFDSDFQIHE